MYIGTLAPQASDGEWKIMLTHSWSCSNPQLLDVQPTSNSQQQNEKLHRFFVGLTTAATKSLASQTLPVQGVRGGWGGRGSPVRTLVEEKTQEIIEIKWEVGGGGWGNKS